MAQLKSTLVQGALTVTGNVVASKLIKNGGTRDDILLGDGSTTSKAAIMSAINAAVELKGTLGTGGTITSLPTAADQYLGDAYKVITAGTYASTAAKVGDMFICYKPTTSTYAWMHIPSGDDIEDTWREVQVNGTQILASGTSTKPLNLKAGTNMSISNSDGTVTFTATDTGATAVSTTGSGNAFTSAEYNASTRTITFTKGLTFLTSHQSIKNLKTDNTTAQTTSASEAIAGSGTINLHKVSKTGTYSDLIGTPDLDKYVEGPSSSTDNAVVRYNGATGKLIQDSGVTIDDSNNITTNGIVTIQNGSAGGALRLGANVNGTTLTANERKLGRMVVPTYDSTTKYLTIISADSQSANNIIDFGGHPNNTSSVAPDTIRFIVANSHDNKTDGGRAVALQISKQDNLSDVAGGGASVAAAKFFVPVHSNNGYIHSGLTAASGKTRNDYILLAGGSTKDVSDFAMKTDLDKYLPLTGSSTTSTTNNMTGPITFWHPSTLTAGKTYENILINSYNKDVNIWHVYGNSGSWASQFGFNLFYKGEGSGNENYLALYAHNQTGTHQEVYRILQDGTTTWKTAINFTGGISENGTTLVNKYQAKDADLTAIAGLTGTSGFLKKTAANTWALDTSVITGSGTSGCIAKFNGTNSVTSGPAFGTGTTKYLREDGTWQAPPNDNTTYGADRGISLVSGKFGHSNTAVTAVTTAGLYKIKYDAYGHITGTEAFTLPTVNNGQLTMNTSGTGVSGSATFTANQSGNSTFTVTLDSSAAGNRAANKVVLAKAAGQIDSDKFTVTSAGTTKSTIQYNTTEGCLEFVFA